jgi:hypothetical protein
MSQFSIFYLLIHIELTFHIIVVKRKKQFIKFYDLLLSKYSLAFCLYPIASYAKPSLYQNKEI